MTQGQDQPDLLRAFYAASMGQGQRFARDVDADRRDMRAVQKEYVAALDLTYRAMELRAVEGFSFLDEQLAQLPNWLPDQEPDSSIPDKQLWWLTAAEALTRIVHSRALGLAAHAPPMKDDAVFAQFNALVADAEDHYNHVVPLLRAAQRDHDLQELVTQSREVVAIAKEAAGRTAASSLTGHFVELRDSERWIAEFWRLSAAGTLIWTVFLAVNVTRSNLQTHEQLANLGLGVAILALSGFCAAQAKGHFERTRWAATTVVQLQTFEAFVAPMGEDQRLALREHFGRRVFGEFPSTGKDEGSDTLQVSLSDLIALVRKTT